MSFWKIPLNHVHNVAKIILYKSYWHSLHSDFVVPTHKVIYINFFLILQVIYPPNTLEIPENISVNRPPQIDSQRDTTLQPWLGKEKGVGQYKRWARSSGNRALSGAAVNSEEDKDDTEEISLSCHEGLCTTVKEELYIPVPSSN